MWRVAVLAASCIALSNAGQVLPPYIKPCARTDPNLSECIIKHANDAIPRLVKGDRKFKIPVLDPFAVDEVKILDDGSRRGAAGISITLKNAKVYGMKDSRVTKAVFNVDQHSDHYEVFTPRVDIVGEYEASGRILLLPISGKGNVTMTLEGINVIFDEHWYLTPRDGERYLIRDNVTVVSDLPKNFHINIGNLFNGNKLLGDEMNTFINENWRDAYKELSPAVFKVLTEIILSVLVRISSVVPYDNIYPEKLPS